MAPISGYYVERKTGISTTYSINEYSGYYLKSSMEEHSITIDNVHCNHSKGGGMAPKTSYDNSLTGYFDGVADEPKTKSESSVVVNLNSCNSNLNDNSMRVYHDHAEPYSSIGKKAIIEKNEVVSCTGETNLSKNQTSSGTYNSPAVENTLYAFTEVSEKTYEYSAEEKEDPTVNCIFDAELIIPKATLDVQVCDCNGEAVSGMQYKVVNEAGEEVTLVNDSADVPLGKYELVIESLDEGYTIRSSEASVDAVVEGKKYKLFSYYHKNADELAKYKAESCEEDGYSGDVICSICKETAIEGHIVEKTGHSFTSFEYNTEEEGDTHSSVCDNGCGKTDVQPCEFSYEIVTPATYENEGLGKYTCIYCNHSYTKVIPVNTCKHNNTKLINDAPARCEIKGYTGDTYCNDCEQVIATGTSIDALEHSYKEYNHNEEAVGVSKHIAYCDNGCGSTDEADCTFDYEVTLEPTKKLDGEGTYTCPVCNYKYTEPIPALGYGSITIGANATENGIAIDSNISLSYYVQLNGEAYNGVAIGSDGKSYQITDGKLTLPYDVTALIDELDNDTTYIVKMLGYDNEKYALINESEPEFGEISTKEYYVTINGNRRKVTASQFNKATNNGENLTVATYIDENYNQYEDVSSISGYKVKRTEIPNVSTSYSLEDYSSYYATESLSQFDVSMDADCQHTRKDTVQWGITLSQTHTVNTTVNAVINGVAIDPKTSSANNITSAKDARSKCNELVQKDTLRAYYDATSPYIENGNFAILQSNTMLGDCDISFDEQGTKNSHRDSISNTIYTFTPVTPAEATYDIVNVKSEKSCIFDAVFAPAPTGTFVVDFVIYQGTVPEAYDGAEFEIKSESGKVLTADVDYTASVDNKSVDLKLAEIGYTVYKFAGLKAGNYTIKQLKTADGFILDVNEYAFNVSRETGAVTGENFSTSDFDSKQIALTNNVYNLVKDFKVFKNNCFSIDFTTLDQKNDPVKDAKFMAIERDAFMSLLWTLIKSGVSSIGSMDINEVLKQLQETDWQNIDASTIINIILSIVQLSPDALGDITLPAILTTSSDENGLVSLSNSANMLNMIGAIANEGITGAQLAEILEKYFGNIITDDMKPLLDALAVMTGNIKVHTGMPAGSYIMAETEAPKGYNRSSLIYTMTVSSTGTAVASAGIIIPVIVDTINTEFGIDLREILINEEEFNKINETVGTAFNSFTEYSNAVIDEVVGFLGRIIGEENAPAEVLNKIKDKINEYNDKYDDLAFAIGQTIKDINSTITDEMTSDWVFVTPRIFVDVKLNITDCKGNAVSGVECSVYDINGYNVEVKDNKVNVPFGTYTTEITSLPDGYYLIDESNVTSVAVDDENGDYSFNYQYHISGEITNAVEPTCTEGGYTGDAYCEFCHVLLKDGEDVDALGHDFAEWSVDSEPTCTEKGSESRVCARCNIEEQRDIDAKGHVYVGVVTEPTCTDKGFTTYTCDDCNDEYKGDYVDALGHTEVIYKAVSPTCVDSGLTEGKACSVCGVVLVEQETIDALGHDMSAWEVIDSPSCVDSGSKKRTCSRCDYTETDIIDENGHSWNEDFTIDKPATCVEAGSKSIHCSACDAVKDSEVIPATGHTEVTDEAVPATCTTTGLTEGKHCSVCDVVIVEQAVTKSLGHKEVVDEAVPATCTATGLTEGKHCSVCDKVLVEQTITGELGHTEVTDEAVAPSCTKSGLTEGSHCSVCGVVLVEQNAVSPLGHTEVVDEAVPATCTTSGLAEGKHCSVCGKVLVKQANVNALGHKMSAWKTVTAPDCTTKGSEKRACSRCDYTETRDIDENGHSWDEDFTVDTPATCTEDGSKSIHCSVCDAVKDVTTIEALDHDFGGWSTITAPDCTTKGSEKRACSRCDYTETRNIDENGHSWNEDFTVDKSATCTEDGSKSIHCSVCDAVKDSEVIPATGHSWDEGTVTLAPTTEEFGILTIKCAECGEEYTTPIDKLSPEIVKGMNTVYEKGSGDSALFKSNASLEDFIEVLVDNEVVDPKYYELKQGSTIAILSAEFMETLEVGVHTLGIRSTTGLAETQFEITTDEEEEPTEEEPTEEEPTEEEPTEEEPSEDEPETTEKDSHNNDKLSPETGSEALIITASTAGMVMLLVVLLALAKRRRDEAESK